eukprot:Pompholyxophrys_sp_v1_NODE_49_length_3016_cov_4.701891.p1 type:complete len:352 gc:universal NODE_49_length_3016_cov_4.701891:2536-1481(-)
MIIRKSYPSTRTLRRQRSQVNTTQSSSDKGDPLIAHNNDNNNINNNIIDNNSNEVPVNVNDDHVVLPDAEADICDAEYNIEHRHDNNFAFYEDEEGRINNENDDLVELEGELDEAEADALIQQLKTVPDDDEEFYLSILLFAFRFNLSNSAIRGLMLLLKYALPNRQFHTSMYHLRKHFQTGRHYDIYYYCNECLKMLESEKHVCGNIRCASNTKVNVGMFSIFHLNKILQSKFDNPTFRKQRQYKNNRTKLNQNNIEDVMDGQKWGESAELYNNDQCIVIGLSLDGVPIYNSTKRTMWPIWMVYYDIPPSERYKQNNMTLLGVSFGSRPIMNRFLSPIIRQISMSVVTPI